MNDSDILSTMTNMLTLWEMAGRQPIKEKRFICEREG